MLVFKKSYYKKIKDLEREVEERKKIEIELRKTMDLSLGNLSKQKDKQLNDLVEIKLKLEEQLSNEILTNERKKQLLINTSKNIEIFKDQLASLTSDNKKLQIDLKLKVTELERENNISKGEKLKVENLEREVKESKAREGKLQNMLDLGLENQKKEKAELKIKIEALLKDRLALKEKLNNEISVNKRNEKLLIDASKHERKLESEIEKQIEEFHKSLTDAVNENDELRQRIENEILLNQKTKSSLEKQLEKQQLEIKELKEIEVELRRTTDLSLENLSKQKDEKLKKLEEQLNEKILVNKRRKQFLIDTSKDTEILKKQLANLMSDNKKLQIDLKEKNTQLNEITKINNNEKLQLETSMKIETERKEEFQTLLADSVTEKAELEQNLEKQIELGYSMKLAFEQQLENQVLENQKLKDGLKNINARTEKEKGKVIIEFNKQSLENEKLNENLTNIVKENKDLQDKLHQKERSAFKLSIISKEATDNLSLLKGQVELLSNDNIKYKTEINSLKDQLKETEKNKQLKVSSFDPINKSKDSLEKQTPIKKEPKPNSSSQINEDFNKSTDIKNLNKKHWSEVLEFGTKHKIFNNRDKQKLNNIIVRLKIREPLRPAQIEEGEELFELVIKNGFKSPLSAELNTPKKIEKDSCLTPFGKEFNRKSSKVSEKKIPEVLEKTDKLDEDELLEKVKTFKYDEWTQMFEWAKKNKKLKSKDLSLLNGLAIRSNNKELSENELILGLELYFILMSEGFELVKEDDVDDFLMQFVDEGVNRVSTMDKKEEIPDILKNILF